MPLKYYGVAIMIRSVVFLSACALALSGCSTNLITFDGAQDIVAEQEGLRSVDLPNLLDPDNLRGCVPVLTQSVSSQKEALGDGITRHTITVRGNPEFGYVCTSGPTVLTAAPDTQGSPFADLQLSRALQAFYHTHYSSYGAPKDRRNRIAERLVAASAARCADFKKSLNGAQAVTNSALGSLATILAGLGAIASDAPSSQALAGWSAITGGVRAQINEDFFRNKLAEAITRSISLDFDAKTQVMRGQFSRTIDDYPVEAAIRDAVELNESCTLDNGIGKLSQAVSISADPVGLLHLNRTLAAAGYEPNFDFTFKRSSIAQDQSKPAQILRGRANSALSDINEELEQLVAHADDAKGKSCDDPCKEEIENELKRVATRPNDGDQDIAAGPAIAQLFAQLEKDKASYESLRRKLRSASGNKEKSRLDQRLRDNDARAQRLWEAIAERIAEARNNIKN